MDSDASLEKFKGPGTFKRQVVIIKAHIIPKKLYNISEISTMPLLNYWTINMNKIYSTN